MSVYRLLNSSHQLYHIVHQANTPHETSLLTFPGLHRLSHEAALAFQQRHGHIHRSYKRSSYASL